MIFLSILMGYADQKPFSSHYQPQLLLHRPMIKELVLKRLMFRAKLISFQAQIQRVQSKPFFQNLK
jgi:hypothetical protein